MTTKVSVKWGKQKYDLEINLSEPPSVFKAQLFTLTNVLPDRQKILIKGGTLKDDSDWSTLGIKDGYTFMLMGSAETDIPKPPVVKPVFVEDLSSEDLSNMDVTGFPAGLHNLGNTCYMNATIQCLKAVPELHKALKLYPGNSNEEVSNNLTSSMRDLFNLISNTNQPIAPFKFLQFLRTAFPQFSQKGQNGSFMQQDAEECWTQLLLTLSSKLPPFLGSKEETGSKSLTMKNSAIGQLFSGEIVSNIINTEKPEEKITQLDDFHKLPCHISSTTNFLIEGLKSGLEENLTKKSEMLGKECVYKKSSRICKLPYYLTIQFVRFFWKQDTKVKAKISRPVEYPFLLDLYDMCTEDLKEKLLPQRKLIIEAEDKKLEATRKKMKEDKSGKEEITNKKDQMEIDGPIDPDKFVNDTGFYELIAVLTHKGRNADSGHYVGWVKESEDKWFKFDDDNVSVVNNEEIKKLSGKGGSDWHTAYLCLYRSKCSEQLTTKL